MPAHHSFHVALTAELCSSVVRRVASGRYRSSSEVVRASLRMLERAEAKPIGVGQNSTDAAQDECR